MHCVFEDYLEKFVIVFSDNILAYSKTTEKHEKHLLVVLEGLAEKRAYAKFKECEFWLEIVSFLGHLVSKEGSSVDPPMIEAVSS